MSRRDTTTVETYLSPAEFGRQVPGRPVSAVTVWGWCVNGLKGRNGEVIRLRHIRVGKFIQIKPEWGPEFFESLANARTATYPVQHPVRNRDIVPLQASHYAAEAALREAGM